MKTTTIAALAVILLAVVVLAATILRAPASPVSGAGVVLGDANCDGTVNNDDVLAIFVSEGNDPVPCPENADVNCNGQIDSLDASLILQWQAGGITDAGCGPLGVKLLPTITATSTITPSSS